MICLITGLKLNFEKKAEASSVNNENRKQHNKNNSFLLPESLSKRS